jgi:hypothetical protein
MNNDWKVILYRETDNPARQKMEYTFTTFENAVKYVSGLAEFDLYVISIHKCEALHRPELAKFLREFGRPFIGPKPAKT